MYNIREILTNNGKQVDILTNETQPEEIYNLIDSFQRKYVPT